MKRKAERVKFAKFLRRHCKLTLPVSVKVAKFWLHHEQGEWGKAPEPVIERLEPACCDGCCYKDVHYLVNREGQEVLLARLSAKFHGYEFQGI